MKGGEGVSQWSRTESLVISLRFYSTHEPSHYISAILRPQSVALNLRVNYKRARITFPITDTAS